MSANINTSQRYTGGRRCVICGGAEKDPRGRGRRCYGYISSDSKYAHCSREEHAGSIKIIEDSQTYAHKLTGPCLCGTTHGTDESNWNNIEVAYDYRDENGRLLYQVVRKIPKTFQQRRPDGSGGWIWSIGDTRRVPYRLPQLLASPSDQLVFIVEGEKDVERLRERASATCNPGGAKKWNLVDECARQALRGRHIAIVCDADQPGREHAELVKEWAREVAGTIRVIDLAPNRDDGYDLSDWLDEGHTVEELKQITEGTEAIETGIEADPWPGEIAKALEDVQRALGEQARHHRRPLFGVDAVDLLRADFPPTQWQITGLITKGGTAVVAGEPKAGIKTWMLIEGSVAVATGTPMFGQFYAEQGTVAIFFAEDKAQAVRNRLRALLSGGNRTIPPGRLFLQPRGEFIDVLKDEDLAWLIASARRLPKLDLLVLDPLRDIHGAAEDKSDEMSPVMKRLRLLGDLIGCTVWISHHTPKASKDSGKRRAGQNMRGSSAIHGSIDSGLYIEPLEGDGTTAFRASVTSQIKDARSAGTFEIELAIKDDDSGAATDAAWSRCEEPRDEEDDTVVAWISELAREGKTFTPTKLRDLKTNRPSGTNNKPIPDRRMRAILDRLIKVGRVRLIGGFVTPTEPS